MSSGHNAIFVLYSKVRSNKLSAADGSSFTDDLTSLWMIGFLSSTGFLMCDTTLSFLRGSVSGEVYSTSIIFPTTDPMLDGLSAFAEPDEPVLLRSTACI